MSLLYLSHCTDCGAEMSESESNGLTCKQCRKHARGVSGGVVPQRLRLTDWHPPVVQNGPHGHWAAAAKRRRQAKALVASLARVERLRSMDGLVRVTYVYSYLRTVRADPDNLIARGKPVLDGLVLAGVLAGDTTTHVEFGPPRIEKGDHYFEVILECAAAPAAGQRE